MATDGSGACVDSLELELRFVGDDAVLARSTLDESGCALLDLTVDAGDWLVSVGSIDGDAVPAYTLFYDTWVDLATERMPPPE